MLAKDRATIQAAVATGGPVIVYFSVQSSFYRYSGGIYPASSCSGTAVNHAMVRAQGAAGGEGGGACVRSMLSRPSQLVCLEAACAQHASQA